jgi:dienelactone hydrolase
MAHERSGDGGEERRTYPKTSHGFSVRGNAADPHVSAMRKEALDDVCDFLRTHL